MTEAFENPSSNPFVLEVMGLRLEVAEGGFLVWADGKERQFIEFDEACHINAAAGNDQVRSMSVMSLMGQGLPADGRLVWTGPRSKVSETEFLLLIFFGFIPPWDAQRHSLVGEARVVELLNGTMIYEVVAGYERPGAV